MTHSIRWVETDHRDRKFVVVDGVPWARTWATHHGMHGVSYTFEQIHGETIRRKKERNRLGLDIFHVTVRSLRRRDLRHADLDHRPTEQRIIDEARKLIAEGLLIHPDEQKRQNADRLRAMERGRKLAAEREERAFVQHAHEAARKGGFPGERNLVIAIVAAMRWAQTK